jgi:hypothetical protein|tara:strand:+ start:1628 stop:1924 length:297 start_codon:yes stop_codon:yes gene_type:complete
MGLTVNEATESVKALTLRVEELEALLNPVAILSQEDSSWRVVRQKRDALLRSTDWVMTPGSTIDQAAWAAYRQALRDLPQTYQAARLEDISWPVQPSL